MSFIPANEGINEGINTELNDNERAVLNAIITNPNHSVKKIEETTGISRATIERAIKKLKDRKIIERVGSNKTGYWKIN